MTAWHHDRARFVLFTYETEPCAIWTSFWGGVCVDLIGQFDNDFRWFVYLFYFVDNFVTLVVCGCGSGFDFAFG